MCKGLILILAFFKVFISIISAEDYTGSRLSLCSLQGEPLTPGVSHAALGEILMGLLQQQSQQCDPYHHVVNLALSFCPKHLPERRWQEATG